MLLVTATSFQLAASRKGAAIFMQKNKPRPGLFDCHIECHLI